ncbi:hypothetical protein ACFU6I_07140 [Streptomyces sp. NPDC057486]
MSCPHPRLHAGSTCAVIAALETEHRRIDAVPAEAEGQFLADPPGRTA